MSHNLYFTVILSLYLTCVNMEPKTFVGPKGIDIDEDMTCEEFSRFARFNPYSVLNEKWFIFYYWGNKKHMSTYIFTVPTANDTKNLHNILDNRVDVPVNWSARHVLMWDQRKTCHLLTERDDRGAYWLYEIPQFAYINDYIVRASDIRIKQIGDNMFLGLMYCREYDVYALSKLSRIPVKSYLQDAAAKIGYRGRRGKSYLYQGHSWMPIPEATEIDYWTKPKRLNRIAYVKP